MHHLILVSMQHKSRDRRGKRAGLWVPGAVSRGSDNNGNKSWGEQDEGAAGVPASNRSTDGGTWGIRAPGARAIVCTGKSNGQWPVDIAVSGRQDQAQCGVDTHQGRPLNAPTAGPTKSHRTPCTTGGVPGNQQGPLGQGRRATSRRDEGRGSTSSS